MTACHIDIAINFITHTSVHSVNCDHWLWLSRCLHIVAMVPAVNQSGSCFPTTTVEKVWQCWKSADKKKSADKNRLLSADFCRSCNIGLMCWLHCRDNAAAVEETVEEQEMRERRPNASNRVDLLELMAKTRLVRRSWIESHKPSITEIISRYPRLHDVDEAVSFRYSYAEFVKFIMLHTECIRDTVLWLYVISVYYFLTSDLTKYCLKTFVPSVVLKDFFTKLIAIMFT